MHHLKCMTREKLEYQGKTAPCHGDLKIAEYFKMIVLSNGKNLKSTKVTGFLVGDLLHELV